MAVRTIVEHIHSRLWHGQVRRALDLIGETLPRLTTAAEAVPISGEGAIWKVAAAEAAVSADNKQPGIPCYRVVLNDRLTDKDAMLKGFQSAAGPKARPYSPPSKSRHAAGRDSGGQRLLEPAAQLSPYRARGNVRQCRTGNAADARLRASMERPPLRLGLTQSGFCGGGRRGVQDSIELTANASHPASVATGDQM